MFDWIFGALAATCVFVVLTVVGIAAGAFMAFGEYAVCGLGECSMTSDAPPIARFFFLAGSFAGLVAGGACGAIVFLLWCPAAAMLARSVTPPAAPPR